MDEMNETERTDTDETPQYTAPTISDYGDLIELTAAGATGGHLDGTYYYGDTGGFISSAP
jgi:hypothetical protein